MERARRAAVALARAAVESDDPAIHTEARRTVEAASPRGPGSRAKAEALGAAGQAIREAGLEAHDADLRLATTPDGGQAIVCHPISPEAAHVRLLEPLYEFVEAMVLCDPLLALERQASAWWFERWTPSRRRRVHQDFPRGVREQEWSLVERSTLRFEMSVMKALSNQLPFGDLPPRQRAMARGLVGSFAGVLRVQKRRGADVAMEDFIDGKRYLVHEHNAALVYHPGDLALGRLIPFGPGRHLRSPGMAFLPAPDASLAAGLRDRFRQAAEELGPAIAVEICTSVVLGAKGLPRRVRPASTKAEAAALHQELQGALLEAGLARQVAPGRVPRELRRVTRDREVRFYEYKLDDAVAGWFEALTERAGTPGRKRPR